MGVLLPPHRLLLKSNLIILNTKYFGCNFHRGVTPNFYYALSKITHSTE